LLMIFTLPIGFVMVIVGLATRTRNVTTRRR
jgi:hypothetical protein